MDVRTLAEARDLLGDVAAGMTDAEVLAARDWAYELAAALVGSYRSTRRRLVNAGATTLVEGAPVSAPESSSSSVGGGRG